MALGSSVASLLFGYCSQCDLNGWLMYELKLYTW